MFAAWPLGYANYLAPTRGDDTPTKPGPANPHGTGDLDAPTPPGSSMRSDAPAGTVAPGGPGTPNQPEDPEPVERPSEPVVEPSSTPEGPTTIPTPATPEGEPGPDATALREPSDNSGNE